ncbi:MAG: DUF559 domain-containing protein, partial [Dehalococcoidales bacterium]|nr:DUF559 domain-containing protein [Dehalococcoidales bacterium]
MFIKREGDERIACQLIPKVPICGACKGSLEAESGDESSKKEERIVTCPQCGKKNRVGPYVTQHNVEAIHDSLSELLESRQKLQSSKFSWMKDAIDDISNNNSALWHKRLNKTKDSIASIENLVTIADDNSIEFLDATNIKALYDDARKLKEHMANGGKLGWGPFRTKTVKERLYVIKNVRLNGRPCSTVELFSILCDALLVRIKFEDTWQFWSGMANKTPGPYALQLEALKSLCSALKGALSLESLIEKCREAIQSCAVINEPIWSDDSQVKKLIASCQLAQVWRRKQLAAEKIQSIEAQISSIVANSKAHPITTEVLNAIRDRDSDGFTNASSKIQELKARRQRLQGVDEHLAKLSRLLPNFTDELKQTYEEAYWDERFQHIEEAWHWAQARYWIEEYIRQEDLPALAKRAKQIEDEINVTIAKLASLHAWSFCFSRLKEGHRRNMKAWQKNVSKITKSGTGKQDFFHRREAQKNLNNCREAIPAWVMPLHRIWDTVDPEPGMFDVIIVDEASQCGFEALPLFYMAKKILIVGDDKQISPEAEGVSLNAVTQLINQFLYDLEYKASFNINRSLFDHGELRYSSTHIVLREHFRCMPEIIRFSNNLCYTDTPLIPLRQYGPNRLPPLQHVFVEGGYREGSYSRAINRPEAKAIVEKIVELCSDERYAEKTMGVIVLQGNAQAGLVEDLLLKQLGAEEMDRRRLICGNPYSFQGDERDVMFLSMVAAPNERIGSLAKAADERRFNVAVSRAKDQVWLFHSVQLEDLSEKDLRRRLLEFFVNSRPPLPPPLDRDELERRAKQDNRGVVRPPAPFESWFEVDVALELLRKGFIVAPQFKVAGKRIDLVVEGGHARLAVECDGDHWHGADRYEEDMQRQRILERCGWVFFRIRASAFYANRDNSLHALWTILEELGIQPQREQEPAPDDRNLDFRKQELSYNKPESDFGEGSISRPATKTEYAEIGDTIVYISDESP